MYIQLSNHVVSTSWFTETDVKHFTSGALRTITNKIKSMVNLKKKRFPSEVTSKIFLDIEKLSKLQISLQMFFKDFSDRLKLPTLRKGSFEK